MALGLKMFKTSPKTTKIVENGKNRIFLDLWGTGTSEIILNLFIKWESYLVNIFQPQVSDIWALGSKMVRNVQKCCKVGENSTKL